VGAGYTGLAAALELAIRGVAVVVLDSADAGWGASSRNGGMVLTGLKLGPRELVARFGMPAAQQMDAASVSAIDNLERLIREHAIECDFVRCGHLALASKPAHFDGYKHEAELVNGKFGRTVRLVPRTALGEEIGSEAYCGGLVDAASAGVNPARLVHGLARSIQRHGATLCEHANVLRVERTTHNAMRSFRLITSRGQVVAQNVILATGGYSGTAFPALRRRVIPIGSYVIATAVLPEQLAAQLSPRNRMMFDSKHFLHYFRLTPNRRLLFGGRASFVPESKATIDESAKSLRADLIRIFPQLHETAVERTWGGTIDFTFDMLPHAGTLEGVHYAVGYAGHGVAMAVYLGGQVARMVTGEPVDDPLVGRRLPGAPLGLYDGSPWFLPLAASWYKMLDWVS
jgi:glycine/D-amino acid oxidase-like deaminating enzyme